MSENFGAGFCVDEEDTHKRVKARNLRELIDPSSPPLTRLKTRSFSARNWSAAPSRVRTFVISADLRVRAAVTYFDFIRYWFCRTAGHLQRQNLADKTNESDRPD